MDILLGFHFVPSDTTRWGYYKLHSVLCRLTTVQYTARTARGGGFGLREGARESARQSQRPLSLTTFIMSNIHVARTRI